VQRLNAGHAELLLAQREFVKYKDVEVANRTAAVCGPWRKRVDVRRRRVERFWYDQSRSVVLCDGTSGTRCCYRPLTVVLTPGIEAGTTGLHSREHPLCHRLKVAPWVLRFTNLLAVALTPGPRHGSMRLSITHSASVEEHARC